MIKKICLLAAGIAIGATSTAVAATAWRPFATSSDSGQYGTFANADARTTNPGALAVRATAKADITWTINCDGATKAAAAGQVIVADVEHATTCSLLGDANGGPGKMTLQLLKR